MRFVRKAFLLLLCAALVLCLAACGGGKDKDDAQPTAQTEPTAEPEAEPTGEPEAEPTDAPEAEPTDEPEAAPTAAPTSAPTPEPTEEPAEYLDVLALDETEQAFVDALVADGSMTVVSDEDYIETLTRLQDLPSGDMSMPFQVEGVYALDNGSCRVYRTVTENGQSRELGLYLLEQAKPIADGAWVRVTGLLMEGQAGGETVPALQVLAIEALAEAGASELAADGQ